MLITFSGVVGSGKSTAAKYTVDTLSRSGIRAKYLRFRSLTYLEWRRQPFRPHRAKRSSALTFGVGPAAIRGRGYRRRKLTLSRALGYMARALVFRVLRFLSASRTCLVVNRYFYDNLAHYQLTTRAERLYISLLKFVIPAPDLPCVLVASDETIAERRPHYAHAYVVEVREGYQHLLQYFPELIVVRADAAEGMQERVDDLLRVSLARLGC